MSRRKMRASLPPPWMAWLSASLMLFGCGGESPTAPRQEQEQEQEQRPAVAVVSVTSPHGALLAAGVDVQLAVEARDGDGAAVAGTTFDWSSSDEGVATVSGAGLLETLAAGPVVITATADGVEGEIALTVAAADLQGIAMLVDDPFTEAVQGAVSDAAESSIAAALGACRDGTATGGLTAVQQCLTDVRAVIDAPAAAAEAPLLGVLAILMDRVERLLNL